MQKEHSISTHIDLRQTIIRSAETYLHHITASGQTTSPIKLRGTPMRVDEHVYLPLALRGGMEPNDLTINDKAAKIVAYNADKAMLKVRLDGEISADRIKALEVYSDISFLARRILNWAQAQDVEFTAGAVLSSLADQPILIPSASDEQRQAIEGVLSSPLAYVWGVPGAGKTSVVLAECIARYMLAGGKVLLVAPTNSALERALEALLPILEQVGCDKSAILRLGFATAEFRRQFPGLCRGIAVLDGYDAPQLVAATADMVIAKYEHLQRYGFEHVFLDEAGYCSLIKALPLLTFDCPLTLLGDHKQLPPVCPIGWREIKSNPELCLWSLSAVYLGNLLQAYSIGQLAAAYKPDFTFLHKYDLGCSSRFGGDLASILSDEVYEGILHGMAPTGTSITVFHAPRCGKSRDSPNEAAVIEWLLRGVVDTDYAVITPYRKQASLLHKLIPDGEVMTIHKSQGLEWDTVILSAVDAEEMFFTDSTKIRGNALLNTALSRARKHLVIVCDADCWAKRPQQLLGRLVLAAGRAVA